MIMATSGGLCFFLLFLVFQVLASAESASMDKPSRILRAAPSYRGGRVGPERQSIQTDHRPPHRGVSTRPQFSEEDATVLIGSDIELPYTLYKQILESAKSSDAVLSLLPTNMVRAVSGYAELKDIVKNYGDDTKVIISKEIMIPAVVYLRIVVLNPEEVMVQFPNGEVIPNIIFQERLGKKIETQEYAGQRYYPEVSQSDYHPFVIEGNQMVPSHHQSGGHEPKTHKAPPQTEENYYGGPTGSHYEKRPASYPDPYTPQHTPGHPPTVPPREYEASYKNSHLSKPHLPPPAVPPHFEAPMIGPYGPLAVPTIPCHSELSHNVRPSSRGKQPLHYSAPLDYPVSEPTPHCPDNLGEQKTYLPSGVHFVDTARCHVCDSASHVFPHFSVFTV